MRTVKINIDLDEVFRIIQGGVYRAAYFLGLGLNAINKPDLKSADLLPFTTYNFGAKDFDEDAINQIRDAFQEWIICNCLRDLVESFALCCDAIVETIIYITCNGSSVLMGEIRGKYKKATNKGVKEKLKYIKKFIEIDDDETSALISINNARNCLVHNNGRIAQKHCNQGDKLRLQWIGLRTYLELDGKHEVAADERVIETKNINGEITGMSVGYEIKEKFFNKGSVVKISPQDLADICFFFSTTSEKMRASLREYIKSRGIEIVNKQDANGDISEG